MSLARRVTLRAFHRNVRRLVVLGGAGLVSACTTPPPAPPAQPSADAWAVVDGHEIVRADVEKAYKRSQPASPVPSEDEALTAKLSLLDELIVQDILLAKATALKLEITAAELDAAYADGRKNIPDEAFQQELTRRGLTVAEMRDGIRQELLSRKVIEREVMEKVNIADQDVTDYYNANRAQFNLAENAFHIAQIVVTPVRDPQVTNRTGDDATTPEKATAKAQMLMERLKTGASFSDLAMDFSEDPESAPRGGDLGFVVASALNQAPPALRDAVLKSSPGTVNTVSAGGAHMLVLLVAREAAGQRDLSAPAVRDGIAATLRGRKEQLLRTAFLGAVRSEAKVVNLVARRVLESSTAAPPALAPKAPGAP